MKLTVDAAALHAALDAPHRVAPQYLLLIAGDDTLVVVADNLIVRVACWAEAAVEDAGRVVVPAALMHDLAHAMPPGPVSITVDDLIVELHGGLQPDDDTEPDPVRASLWVVPDDYSMIPPMPPEPPRIGEVAMTEFAASMAQVTPAAPVRSPLPVVAVRSSRGALLCAATDSYRLHLTRSRMVEASAWAHEALIPVEAIKLATSMFPDGTANLHMDRDVLTLRTDTGVLTTRLSTAKFPNYQKVIPRREDAAAEVMLDTAALLAALARITPIANTEHGEHRVRLAAYPEDRIVTVESSADGLGQSKATIRAAAAKGAGFSFSTDIRYLHAAARASACQRLTVYWTAPRKPILIAGFGAEFSAMVMPHHKPNPAAQTVESEATELPTPEPEDAT